MLYLPPAQVEALLEERIRAARAAERAAAGGHRRCWRQGLDRLFLVEAEYSLTMQEAERSWTAELLALIRDSPDFTRAWRVYHQERAELKGGEQDAAGS